MAERLAHVVVKTLFCNNVTARLFTDWSRNLRNFNVEEGIEIAAGLYFGQVSKYFIYQLIHNRVALKEY